MIEKIIDRRMMELKKSIFNHFFVIDVKLSNYRNANFLNDPSTINQLIDKVESINKM